MNPLKVNAYCVVNSDQEVEAVHLTHQDASDNCMKGDTIQESPMFLPDSYVLVSTESYNQLVMATLKEAKLIKEQGTNKYEEGITISFEQYNELLKSHSDLCTLVNEYNVDISMLDKSKDFTPSEMIERAAQLEEVFEK